jgi:hypothetical protein
MRRLTARHIGGRQAVPARSPDRFRRDRQRTPPSACRFPTAERLGSLFVWQDIVSDGFQRQCDGQASAAAPRLGTAHNGTFTRAEWWSAGWLNSGGKNRRSADQRQSAQPIFGSDCLKRMGRRMPSTARGWKGGRRTWSGHAFGGAFLSHSSEPRVRRRGAHVRRDAGRSTPRIISLPTGWASSVCRPRARHPWRRNPGTDRIVESRARSAEYGAQEPFGAER